MCDHCGCDEDAHEHEHGHDHTHEHGHKHDHENGPSPADAPSRTVVLERKILSKNDEAAGQNRAWLAERGITAVDIVSSPGAGKTTLLERTLENLRGRIGCAVITGDQQTDNDARRLSGKGAPVRQIETLNACHLDAQTVGAVMRDIVEPDTRLLFIENVGNLVCPAAFDLGENFKVAVLSVTEGEDKPVKYPTLFSRAPVAVLTKTDLIPHLDWDIGKCRESLRTVHPGIFVFELSARTGEGMAAWIDYLLRLVT